MRILGSITNRIFLASALLAMLSIGAAVYFVSARMTTQTEIELHRINRTLAGLGMHPRPVGASPAADATKHAVWRAGRGLKHVLR